MKIKALVPLRGGSKSIPMKNIKMLGGKPLCYWVLESLLKTKEISDIFVSTDSVRIARVVKKLNKDIQIIKRPKHLANDFTATERVMLHFAKKIDFDLLVTVQATSPFTSEKDISNAIKKFKKDKLDSLLTAVRLKRFFWSDNSTPLNYNPTRRPPRQKFGGTLTENGAFYITSKKCLKTHKCRLGGKIGIFEMSEKNFTEIDEPSDWAKVSKLLKNT